MKVKPIIVGVTAIAALGLSGTAAAGGGHAKFKTVRVTFQPTDFEFGPSAAPCDAGGTCLETTTIKAVQTGDLDGATVEADASSAVGTNPRQTTVMGTFTGGVTGCGKNGSFLYNGLRTDTAPDRSEATYLIMPGTGTGDFDGISGVMQQHALGGPITGVFRCKVH